MNCPICTHEKRAEIERDCLTLNFGDNTETLQTIADKYGVAYRDLQVHMLMHAPLDIDDNASESIAGALKKREADILRQSLEDSAILLRNLNTKLSAIINEHTTDAPTLNQINKSVTDLYLGTAQNVRETAMAIIRMDAAINGERDEGLSQLTNLVNVIRGGKPA